MRRNHLHCQHRLDFVVGTDAMKRREYSVDVLLCWRIAGGAITGRINETIEQNTRNPCFRCPPRGVEGVFDTAQVNELLSVISKIRATAA
jgi:hypothetical protein